VGIAGQGNDSNKAKNLLINLSPNIAVIRHPNKIFGRTKAILWSHHEKLVIVDRFTSFPLSPSLSLSLSLCLSLSLSLSLSPCRFSHLSISLLSLLLTPTMCSSLSQSSIAFVGGLDLSLNRYDDWDHRLEDEAGIRWVPLPTISRAPYAHRAPVSRAQTTDRTPLVF
jgi:hypothetical protein